MNWLEDVDLSKVWNAVSGIVLGPPIVRIAIIVVAVAAFFVWWKKYR